MVRLLVIMKPYRKTARNIMDFIIFLLMTVIAAVQVVTVQVSIFVSYSIMILPFLAMICYIFYCVIKCCCNTCSATAKQTETVHQPTSVNHTDLLKSAINSDVVLEDYYTDRILNPSGYNEQHSPYKPLDDSAPAEDDP